MSNQTEQAANFTPMEISERDFHRLSEFVQGRYGIDLSQKRQLISGRMSMVLKRRGYHSFTAFIDHLMETRDPSEITLLLDKLTTNYTYFMRETETLDFLRDKIIPDIVQRHQGDKSLAIWSAGCSSGEEPYNISMYLLDYLGDHAKSWDTRVLATDISEQALSAARRGVYKLPDTVPVEWKRKYFTLNEDGTYTVAPCLKRNVIFQTFNLMSPIQFRRKFDVIFCRNVMIYFDQPTKVALVHRFYDATLARGYFMIGCSENIVEGCPYRKVSPTAFQKL